MTTSTGEKVRQEQRHTRHNPCLICGGYAGMRQGRCIRCAGFRSDDGEYEHCQREEFAGGLERNDRTTPPTYAHKLHGACKCGVTHGSGSAPYTSRGRGGTRQPARVTRYELRDESGQLVGVHVRTDYAGGGKALRWEQHNGRGAAQMPLYNLAAHLAAPADALRIICEGEKATDALNAALAQEGCAAGRVALGTVTGAPAVPDDDSLRPLTGHPVALWPDTDDVGRKQMEGIAARLMAMGAPAPKWVLWPAAPEKGDAADYFAAGGTVAALDHLITKEAPGAHNGAADGVAADGRDSAAEDETPGHVGTPLSAIQPTSIAWLWPGYVPLGMLTILDGDPGVGKSLISIDLAARVSSGRPMPDGAPGIEGGVLILSLEDDAASAIRPRVQAAGGNLNRIRVWTILADGVPSDGDDPPVSLDRLLLPGGVALLEREFQEYSICLVIFDPVLAFLAPPLSANHDQDVRRAIVPLLQAVQRASVAALGIRHLSKTDGRPAIYRGSGSIAISALARSAILCARDPDVERQFVFAPVKNNHAPLGPSWAYALKAGDGSIPRVEWRELSSHKADALVAAGTMGRQGGAPAIEEACEHLQELLADGPMAATEVRRQTSALGVSSRTLDRAKDRLGIIVTKRSGFGAKGGWEWSLPDMEAGAAARFSAVQTVRSMHRSPNTGRWRSMTEPARHAESAKDRQLPDMAINSGDDVLPRAPTPIRPRQRTDRGEDRTCEQLELLATPAPPYASCAPPPPVR